MKKRIIVYLTGGIILLSACYKNSLEELSNSTDCDVSNISYSKDIKPILNISCNISGCHNTNSTQTFSLEKFDEVKAEAESGLLLKSINHEAGVSPMPKNVSKLTDCHINKITAWVNAGTPNN